MANGSTRDVKLTLSVESLGQENVGKLEQALRDLAATGGKSSAEFADLADQIARLGQQNGALQSFKALSTQAEELAQRQQAAADKAEVAKAALDQLTAASNQARDAQQKARAELTAGEQAYVEAGNAIRALKTEYDSAGKQTGEYRTKLQQLVAAQNEARTALVGLRDANREATAEATAAGAAQSKAETAYTRAATALEKATTAADRQTVALRQAKDAANALGVDTTNVVAAENALVSTFANSVNAIESRKAAIADMAESDRLLAIQEKAWEEQVRRGQAALDAEAAAIREAERVTREYEAAKAQAASDAAKWQREADAIVDRMEAERRAQAVTQATIEQLRKLEAQRAYEVQAQQAQKTAVAAEFVRRWAQAMDEADASQQQLAAHTALVNDAFKTLNIRPIEAVQAEIEQTTAAMRTLAASGQLTGRELAVAMQQGDAQIAALQREIRELSGSLTMADRAASLFKNSLGQIAAGNIIADGVGYLVQNVKQAGVEFLQANIAFDSLRRTLTQITGSTQGAADKIEFLRGVAQTAGVSIADTAKSFMSFNSSAMAAGVATEEVDALFKSVAVSASRLGLTSDQVSRALEALGQMAGKGTVSMEELRQQLGDALPGAVSVAAKGLHMTTAELIKLVESGNLTVQQFFPAFRAGLEQTFGSSDVPVKGLAASFGRLQTAITTVYQSAVDSGPMKALAASADFLAQNLGSVTEVTFGLGKALLVLKFVDYIRSMSALGVTARATTAAIAEQTVATVASTAATNANTTAKTANAAASRTQAASMTVSAAAATAASGTINAMSRGFSALTTAATFAWRAMGGWLGVAVAVGVNAKEIGTWLGESAAKMMGYGKAIDEYTAKTRQQAAVEKAAHAERMAQRAADEQALQRETNDLTKSRAVLELRVKTMEEANKAENTRADNLERVISFYGSETAAAQAAVEANRIRITAMQQESDARSQLLATTSEELARRQELVASNPNVSQAYKDETTKLVEKVATMKQEVDQSANTLRALQIEQTAREIHSETLKDNSAKVKQYSDEVKTAQQTVDGLRQMQAQGLPVTEALGRAELALAKATALRNDAMKDAIDKINAKNQLEQAGLNVKQAGLAAQQAAYEQEVKSYQAIGDTNMATYAQIQAKQTQIKITELQAEAKRKEAQATIDATQVEIRELKDTGQFTETKRMEMEARLANAKAKIVEADSSKTTVRALQDEVLAIRAQAEAVKATAVSAKQATQASNERANALTREATATRQLTEEEQNLLRGRTKDGWAINTQGQKVTAGSDVATLTGIANFLKSAGLDEATAKRVALEFSDGNGNIPYINNPGQMKYGGAYSSMTQALLKAAEKYTFAGPAMSSPTNASNTPAASSATAPGSSTPVIINVAGRQTQINVASSSDATALAGLIQQLEHQGSTAS